jgi:hypothetical protein
VEDQSCGEERRVAQPASDRVGADTYALDEDLGVGPERDRRARVGRVTDALDRTVGHAAPVGLAPHATVAAHDRLEPLRERVHDADADAVQAARDRVGLRVELAAGMEHREHDLEGAPALLLVEVDGDAGAVVGDTDATVVEQRDGDLAAAAGERLVDRVVDDLPHEVVEAARSGRADVHARATADGLEPLEDGDRARVVAGLACVPASPDAGVVAADNRGPLSADGAAGGRGCGGRCLRRGPGGYRGLGSG